eukprot:scaffold250781_cov32-Tisochrysis_lutea.AAC.2
MRPPAVEARREGRPHLGRGARARGRGCEDDQSYRQRVSTSRPWARLQHAGRSRPPATRSLAASPRRGRSHIGQILELIRKN